MGIYDGKKERQSGLMQSAVHSIVELHVQKVAHCEYECSKWKKSLW